MGVLEQARASRIAGALRRDGVTHRGRCGNRIDQVFERGELRPHFGGGRGRVGLGQDRIKKKKLRVASVCVLS